MKKFVTAMDNDMPSEIIIRLHIKSVWLKDFDSLKTASTDSGSFVSSSFLGSDISDFDNYRMFDFIRKPTLTETDKIPEDEVFTKNAQFEFEY